MPKVLILIGHQAELDAVLGEVDRRTGRLASLEKLVEEGAPSLFAALDAEKAALSDLSARQEKLAAGLAAARSKAASLYRPEDLLEAIRSGSDAERRLRLKAEIRKRLSRISVLFGEHGWRYYFHVEFVNGALRALGVDKAGRSLAAEVKLDPARGSAVLPF
jgi:multidrug efflux pump subunit AcrA (membrane-fusion protein)